ncbi:MAG TPA: zf-HC2 domain-containing protein [Candidatus Polarisedimenticolaceae bacterium]|nr:zf-HC2 domain-containing protein [Candidatus Polarisedimenticolaceae bacterium]
MTTCDRARPLIVRSVEGELAPRSALRLARHVEACTTCRILLARERRLAQMLDGLDDVVPVDASFLDAVMASLPDRPSPTGPVPTRRERLRRGLRLAGLCAGLVAGGGLAARFLPFLRFDLATPAMPRFAGDETESWLSVVGSAAQWVRMTAQTLSWSIPPGVVAKLAITLAIEAVVVGGVVALATSAAVVLRGGPDSPAS